MTMSADVSLTNVTSQNWHYTLDCLVNATKAVALTVAISLMARIFNTDIETIEQINKQNFLI